MKELLRTHGLHGVARVALRMSSPVRAARIVRAVARFLPPLDGLEAAREAAERLEMRARGTCLTRALTVAARLPGARVAIAVDPTLAQIAAHAWVEIDAHPLRPSDPKGAIIATL